MNNTDQKKHLRWILLTGGILIAFYGLGSLFPEPFWATHCPGMLPTLPHLLLFVLALGLLSLPLWWKKQSDDLSQQQLLKPLSKYALFGGISVGMAALFLLFPIHRDIYGDAFFIQQSVSIHIPDWHNRLILELLNPDWLNTKSGLRTFFELNNFFTWLTGKQGDSVTPVLEAVVGAVYAFLWLKFTDVHLKSRGWKILFGAIGLSAPFLAVFMAHYETYYLSYTGILIWMSALGIYFKTESKKWLIALPFLALLAVQTHITNWLMMPGLFFAFAWHFREKIKVPGIAGFEAAIRKRIPAFQGGLTWSGLAIYLWIPVIIGGIIAYFFIFANHDGPRQFTAEEFENTLFLPLWTDEPAPLDRYNLFSPTHLWDYANLMFMWSGAVILLLVPPLTFLRKKVPWNQPLILITATTFLLFFIVFFTLNPLLAASKDWDLFIAPGIVLLPCLVFIYGHLEKHLNSRLVAGPVLGLCLLGLPFHVVNTTPELLTSHYTEMGKWDFKTYWIGCSTMMITSSQMTGSEAEQQEKLVTLIDELAPFATPGNDREYANLLLEAGLYHRKQQDLNTALEYMEQGHTFGPLLGRNIYFLTLTHFEAGHYSEAYRYGDLLAKIKYPPYAKTLRIAIHTSLAAKEYQSAANYSVTYLNRWQDDPVIEEVEFRLRTGDRIDSLIYLFGE